MNEEIIKEYIQFAINNWYKLDRNIFFEIDVKKSVINKSIIYYYDIIFYGRNFDCKIVDKKWINFIELITSKQFIEAIAKWRNQTYWLNVEIDYITTHQAIAIRDNDLNNFIIKLLWTN